MCRSTVRALLFGPDSQEGLEIIAQHFMPGTKSLRLDTKGAAFRPESGENLTAFLLAISVGSQYGNSIPAILMGIPGSPAAILTVIDGYKLHKRG